MKKRLLVAAGGSGGHLYPAQALAREMEGFAKVLFVGSGLTTNPFFDRESFSYAEVASGSPSLKKPWRALTASGKILKGYADSCRLIDRYSPDLVVGFGSYHSLPPLLAALKKGFSVVMHEANSFPGRVNRLLSPYVNCTAIHFPHSAKFLKGRTEVVGMPLRKRLLTPREAALEAESYYGLDAERLTLLAFGGSQGSRRINEVVLEALTARFPLKTEKLQLIHLTGRGEDAERFAEAYSKAGIEARVKRFEERMELAWSFSDLFIGRAGASTLAEQLEYEVPGILIPYPFATDNHQEKNARAFISQTGGALCSREQELSPRLLAGWIEKLVGEKRALLRAMKQGLAQYKKRLHTRSLSQILTEKLDGLCSS